MRWDLSAPACALVLTLFFAPAAIRAADEVCTVESFGDAVDTSAAELRKFSTDTQPVLKQKLQALRDAKRWTDPDFESKGLELIHDKKLDDFDAQASELLSKIDTLGSPESADTTGSRATCADLAELKAASSELMAVMRAKSAYLIARIDREIEKSGAGAKIATAEPTAAPGPAPLPTPPPAAKEPTATAHAAPQPAPAPESAKRAATEKPVEAKPPPAADKKAESKPPARSEAASSWSTTTADAVIPVPPPAPSDERWRDPNQDLPQGYAPPEPGNPPGVPYELPPAGAYDDASGYTIDEIRDATNGFFGTISTSLASVIEHAFQKVGRPTAYVLGEEGGGAILAGIRYGEGTLYLRNGGRQKVYWHGPSIGYDLGAEGSRTLFLIYHLEEPDRLYRQFTGVDGSAYLVGGVGMTLLKGGPVLMAPIRSGLGLRLGANIGYVRFTPRATWNPF